MQVDRVFVEYVSLWVCYPYNKGAGCVEGRCWFASGGKSEHR